MQRRDRQLEYHALGDEHLLQLQIPGGLSRNPWRGRKDPERLVEDHPHLRPRDSERADER